MRKIVACVSLIVALVCGAGYAGQNEPIVVQNESRTVSESGQTFDLTVTGITAEVVFLEVTPTHVTGTVRRTGGGTSGTFRIFWHETGKSQELKLTISDPYKLFSLEGGDTDKKSGSQVGS
jgi:hypothetical protein